MVITRLSQLIEVAKQQGKKKLVVAYGQDLNTLQATDDAVKIGLIEATITGDKDIIKKICLEHSIEVNSFNIIHEPDEYKAGLKAVEVVNNGNAQIIMKGLISTDKYLKCILNKENGLMSKNKKSVLTHVMVGEVPNAYHKLVIASDCAFIPEPDLYQKIAITEYLIDIALHLGIERPKVALISFTEKANPKVKSCVDAAIISKMGHRGQIKNADIDGPLALDVAIDMESVKVKGLKSKVAGDADCLVFSNLEAGNVFYKTLTKLAKGEAAAVVVGAKVPAILPSRGDSGISKLYSIALSCLMAK